LLVLRADLPAQRGDLQTLKALHLGAAPGPEAVLRRLLTDTGTDLAQDNVRIGPVPGMDAPDASFGVGAFGLVVGKANLLGLYEAAGLGVFGIPLPTLRAAIGGFEMLLGVLCLQATRPAFFVFVCAWKLGTEFLHVPAQAYGAWWEVLERGGSYAAPLLWIGLRQVLAAHGVIAQGVIPRRWRLGCGRAARHAEVRLRS
jgi:hypothetical protein